MWVLRGIALVFIAFGSMMAIWCLAIPPNTPEQQREEDEVQLEFLRNEQRSKISNRRK